MNPPSVDARLLELLVRASSLELFQLNVAIDRMLADPRRIVQVRKDLHLGQTVRFMDWRDGQMRAGKVVVMKDTHLTIHEDGARTSWAVPYAAVEPPALCASKRGAAAEPPSVPRSKRNGFRCGGKVAFEDEYLNTVVGTIVRINQRTATIDPGDGTSWLVAFADLRHATLSTSDLAAVIAQDLPCACADLHVKRRPCWPRTTVDRPAVAAASVPCRWIRTSRRKTARARQRSS